MKPLYYRPLPWRLLARALALAIPFALFVSVGFSEDLPVLVVRGGHHYDTPEFEDMCLDLNGVEADLVLTAHLQQMSAEEIEEQYGAILFLNQNKYYPTAPKHRKQYMDLAERGVGMVFLQFTLSSQPEWDEFHDLVGGKWFLKNYTEDPKRHSTYFKDLTLDIEVLDREHPVTQGLEDFTLTDAFYGNIHIAPGVHPLLGTKHPDISPTIAWTHRYKNSEVVYLMPGFTKGAYQNESYIKLIENALGFVADNSKK
ncbi:MAG: ThuA domain-containing protein [Verrucomicrobiota bacterium]